jgi:drug/metabolite transporter (DMT)-like permease
MSSTSSSFRPRDTALLIILALVWGNSFLFIKTAVAVFPPLWIVAIRMTLGASLLFVIARAMGKQAPSGWRNLFIMGLIGIFGSALPWAGQAWAQRFLDSGLVSVLNAGTPVATMLLAVLMRQERLYANRVAGLMLAVLGTLLVVGVEIHAGRSQWALIVALLATFGYAIAGVLTRVYVSGRVSNVWAAVMQLGWGAVLVSPLAWATQGPPPTTVDPIALAALCALGLLGTGLAFLIYFTLIENVGATNTSMVTYLVPVVGLTSGALFRGERFGANVYLGALAMILGVWLAQRAPRASSLSGS